MRGPTSLARTALAVMAMVLIANCGDDPSAPSTSESDQPGIAFATASSGTGLTISTDKDDYAPGDTVWFTGTGWTPGDSLDIVLTDDTQDYHAWAVGIAGDGTFRDSTYVVDTGDLGVAFTLTATSRGNAEQTLTVNFTDGQPTSVTVTAVTSSIPVGGTASYDVLVAMGGNSNACTITLSASGLPTGTTASFTGNPRSLPAGSGSTNFNSTLALVTTGATPPGTYTISVLATRGAGCQTGGSDPTGTGTLIVFGNASKLAFGQQPSNTDATVAIAPAVTVQVLDANNNLVANSSASVTMAVGTNPGSGTLSGTLSKAAVNGVATFSDLSINKVGTGYRLAASGTSLTGATSNTFNITVGAATQLVFTQQPSGSTTNVPFPAQPTVQVQDAGGNVKTTGTGSGASITLSIVSGTGTAGAALTCTTNPLGASAGTASFGGCAINTAGTNYQVRAAATIGGNPFSVNSSQFNINSGDAAAPTINCTVPSQSIWYGADVTVNCTASDAGSGLEDPSDASFSLSTSVALGTEDPNAQTDSREVCDKNGNCATAGPYTFKVDTKDPTVSCAAADGVWHGDNVSIACTASDGGSGLGNPSDASFTLSTTVPSGTETANASTGTHVVADAVGNDVTAGPVSSNMIDRKAPTVTCGTADGVWHAADVSIGCTASDDGSNLANSADASFSLSTTVPLGTEDANASTNSRSIADAVGNSTTAGPITGNQVDKKAPQFTCGATDGLWHASDVDIGCTATDGGSGLANAGDASFNLSTNVPAGTEDGNASTGTRGVADAVGNSATAGPIAGNMIDKKGPTVNLVCPAAPIILGSTANANWTASDGGSGVASGYESGQILLSTGSVGTKTATAAAGTSIDNVSNNSPVATCTYSVIYLWTGFFQPVDNTNLNVTKAGSAIPVKFNLGGNQGLAIFVAGSPSSSKVACDTQADQDTIEETVNAGGSSLTYDATASQYVYVWKTDKPWANTCRRLDVKLIDGTTHSAYFKFKN
jgi:hypothetical protein